MFAGQQEFLPCLGTNSTLQDEGCLEAKICVLDGTTHQVGIRSYSRDSFQGSFVPALTLADMYEKYKNGTCNLFAGEQFDLAVLENQGLSYEVGDDVLAKELISMVTRDGDPKWSDFVNYIVQSSMTAEELRLSSGDFVATDLETTEFFGSDYATMFQDANEVVGSYDQIYKRHLEDLVPRSSANQINLGYTAAMYAKPLGNLTNRSPDQMSSSTIENIRKRGKLTVGITPDHPMFAKAVGGGEYKGIDADFAKAVAAALFDGMIDGRVEYVPVSAEERFQKLHDGTVHVLARVTTITMERDVMERTTGQGFTFSSPMFHDSVRFVGQSK